jgi:hypothetical protein
MCTRSYVQMLLDGWRGNVFIAIRSSIMSGLCVSVVVRVLVLLYVLYSIHVHTLHTLPNFRQKRAVEDFTAAELDRLSEINVLDSGMLVHVCVFE